MTYKNPWENYANELLKKIQKQNGVKNPIVKPTTNINQALNDAKAKVNQTKKIEQNNTPQKQVQNTLRQTVVNQPMGTSNDSFKKGYNQDYVDTLIKNIQRKNNVKNIVTGQNYKNNLNNIDTFQVKNNQFHTNVQNVINDLDNKANYYNQGAKVTNSKFWDNQINKVQKQKQDLINTLTTLDNAFNKKQISQDDYLLKLEELSRYVTNDDIGSALSGFLLGLGDIAKLPGDIINTGIDIGGELLGSSVSMLGNALGNANLKNLGQDLKGYDPNADNNIMAQINDSLDREAYLNSLGVSDFSKGASDLARSLTNMASDIGLGMVTGGGSVVASGLGATRSITGAYRENLKNGYDFAPSLSNALMHGAVTYFTEKLPNEKLFEMLDTKIGKTLTGYISSMAKQGFSEGVEEGAEYILGTAIDNLILGTNKDYNPGELGYQMLLGALGGVIGGGVATGISHIPNIETKKARNQIEADLETFREVFYKQGLLNEPTVRQTLNNYESAIRLYDQKSMLGNAVKLDNEEPIKVSSNDILNIIQDSEQIDNDAKQNLVNEYTNIETRVLENTQKILNASNINMEANQFLELDDNARQNIINLKNTTNKLGLDVIFDNRINGYGMLQNNVIAINPNTEIQPIEILTHEIVHSLENTPKYADIYSLVLDDMSDIEYQSKYNDLLNKGYEPSLIEGEIIASELQSQLGNEKFIKKLVNYDTSLATRLFNNIKSVLNNEKIENKFFKAFRQAKDNPNLETRYAIRKLDSGEVYVEAENTLGNKPSQKEIRDYLLSQINKAEPYINLSTNNEIGLDTTGVNKYSYDGYNRGRNTKLKGRIVGQLGEVIEIADYNSTKENYKNSDRGKNGFEYYDVTLSYPKLDTKGNPTNESNMYNARLVVRLEEDGRYIYDLDNFKKINSISRDDKSSLPHLDGEVRNAVLDNNISNNPQDVNSELDIVNKTQLSDIFDNNTGELLISDKELSERLNRLNPNRKLSNAELKTRDVLRQVVDKKEIDNFLNPSNFDIKNARMVNKLLTYYDDNNHEKLNELNQKLDIFNTSKDNIKNLKESTHDENTEIIDMLKDNGEQNIGNYGLKTLEMVLDKLSNNNPKLREKLRNSLEYRRNESYLKLMHLRKENKKLYDEMAERGFKEDTKESALLQAFIEKHTNEKEQFISKEGKPYFKWKSFNENDLKNLGQDLMKNGKTIYQNVLEFAPRLEKYYEDTANEINEQRFNLIYGDVDTATEISLEKAKLDFNKATELLEKLEENFMNDPSVTTYRNYEEQAKKVERLTRTLNTKIKKHLKGDDKRREVLLNRKNYAPHFMKPKNSTIFSLGKEIKQYKQSSRTGNDIPTEIITLTEHTKPRSGYARFFNAQTGGDYDMDAMRGFRMYSDMANRIIAFDPYIDYLRDFSSDLKSQLEKSEFNTFTKYIDDYANNLANKTNPIDKALEDRILPRWATKTFQKLNNIVKKNTLLGSFRTVYSQMLNLPNGLAVLTENGASIEDIKNGIKRYGESLRKTTEMDNSPFIYNRFFEQNIAQSNKLEKSLVGMLNYGDEVVTKLIWNIAYETGLRQGKSPIDFADDIARRSVAGRGIGEVPLGLQSEVINLFFPFQVDVNNTWQTFIKQAKGKKIKSLGVMFVADFVLNAIADELFGDKPLLDPIGAFIDGITDSDDDDDVVIDPFTNIIGNMLSTVPFSTALNLVPGKETLENIFGDSYNPSRYDFGVMGVNPLGSAVDNLVKGNVPDAISDVFFNYVTPYGGKQAQRTIENLQSYGILPQIVKNEIKWEPTHFTSGGNVGFTQKNPFTDELTTNEWLDFARGNLFGKWSTENAKDYIERGFKQPSKAELGFKDMGLDKDTARKLNDSIKGIESLKDANGETIPNSRALLVRQAIEKDMSWGEFIKNVSREDAKSYNLNKTVYDMTDSEYKQALKELGIENVATSGLNLKIDTNNKPTTTAEYKPLEDETMLEKLDATKGIKNDSGNTIRNSSSLNKRGYLQSQGLWDDLIETMTEEEAKELGIGKGVYNMTDAEFEQAYLDMFGKPSPEREIKELYNPHNNPILGAGNTLYTSLQQILKDNGLMPKNSTVESNLKQTDINTSKTENDAQKDSNKAEEPINNKYAIVDLSKKIDITKDSLEVAKRKVDYRIFKNTLLPQQKKIFDSVLDWVFDIDIEKTIKEVRQKYIKSSLYDLVKKYLEDNPYADASVFGL